MNPSPHQSPSSAAVRFPAAPGRRRRAFSLVEVTLALGIVTFALVGVVGVMPTALTSGRKSFDQNRAAAVASTLFASFRGQPFNNVGYLDAQFQSDGVTPVSSSLAPRLNLNSTIQASSDTVQFYATFIDVPTDAGTDAFGEQRKLCFTKDKLAGGTGYLVTLHFNNSPDGMVVKPNPDNQVANPAVPAQANQVDMTVSPVAQPLDKYRFISTIANRS